MQNSVKNQSDFIPMFFAAKLVSFAILSRPPRPLFLLLSELPGTRVLLTQLAQARMVSAVGAAAWRARRKDTPDAACLPCCVEAVASSSTVEG